MDEAVSITQNTFAILRNAFYVLFATCTASNTELGTRLDYLCSKPSLAESE